MDPEIGLLLVALLRGSRGYEDSYHVLLQQLAQLKDTKRRLTWEGDEVDNDVEDLVYILSTVDTSLINLIKVKQCEQLPCDFLVRVLEHFRSSLQHIGHGFLNKENTSIARYMSIIGNTFKMDKTSLRILERNLGLTKAAFSDPSATQYHHVPSIIWLVILMVIIVEINYRTFFTSVLYSF